MGSGDITATKVAALLDLKPHPEGGYYSETEEIFILTYMLQMAVSTIHLNGRDTHVHQIKIHGPQPLTYHQAAIEIPLKYFLIYAADKQGGSHCEHCFLQGVFHDCITFVMLKNVISTRGSLSPLIFELHDSGHGDLTVIGPTPRRWPVPPVHRATKCVVWFYQNILDVESFAYYGSFLVNSSK